MAETQAIDGFNDDPVDDEERQFLSQLSFKPKVGELRVLNAADHAKSTARSLEGLTFPLYEGENTIGSLPETSMICLKYPSVSRRHAIVDINLDAQIYTIKDVGSRNGTRIGTSLSTTRRLQSRMTAPIPCNGIVVLGDIQLIFDCYKQRLVNFYKQHNPGKIAHCDEILRCARGQEAVLFQRLNTMYKTSAPDLKSPTSTRGEVVRTQEIDDVLEDANVEGATTQIYALTSNSGGGGALDVSEKDTQVYTSRAPAVSSAKTGAFEAPTQIYVPSKAGARKQDTLTTATRPSETATQVYTSREPVSKTETIGATTQIYVPSKAGVRGGDTLTTATGPSETATQVYASREPASKTETLEAPTQIYVPSNVGARGGDTLPTAIGPSETATQVYASREPASKTEALEAPTQIYVPSNVGVRGGDTLTMASVVSEAATQAYASRPSATSTQIYAALSGEEGDATQIYAPPHTSSTTKNLEKTQVYASAARESTMSITERGPPLSTNSGVAKPTQTYSASKDDHATDTSDDEDDEPTQIFGVSATKEPDAATASIPRTQELWDAEGVASAMRNSDNDSDDSDDSEVMCEAPDVSTISSTPPSLVSATVRGLSPAEEMDEATNADDGDETQDEDVDDEHVDESIETKTTAVASSPPRTRQRKKRSLAVVTKTSMIKIDAKRKKMDSTVDDEPADKKITSRRLRSSSPKDADVETLARHDVIRICFTGVSKKDASRYAKNIALCGPLCHGIVGSSSIVTDDVADATHLVVYDEKTPEKGYKRTLKLLHGICLLARGTLRAVVHLSWLDDSLSSKMWQTEASYIPHDLRHVSKRCRQQGAGPEVNRAGILDGRCVWITWAASRRKASGQPPADELRPLIEAAGGRMVTRRPRKMKRRRSRRNGDDADASEEGRLIIVSTPADARRLKLGKDGERVFNKEILLTGMLRQCLDLENDEFILKST